MSSLPVPVLVAITVSAPPASGTSFATEWPVGSVSLNTTYPSVVRPASSEACVTRCVPVATRRSGPASSGASIGAGASGVAGAPSSRLSPQAAAPARTTAQES